MLSRQRVACHETSRLWVPNYKTSVVGLLKSKPKHKTLRVYSVTSCVISDLRTRVCTKVENGGVLPKRLVSWSDRRTRGVKTGTGHWWRRETSRPPDPHPRLTQPGPLSPILVWVYGTRRNPSGTTTDEWHPPRDHVNHPLSRLHSEWGWGLGPWIAQGTYFQRYGNFQRKTVQNPTTTYLSPLQTELEGRDRPVNRPLLSSWTVRVYV